MDVYNLILDRGYLGALKYASEIEDKNFRLASEIDQIVSELYRTAKGSSGFRYAQSQMPRFEIYRRPSAPQSRPSAPQSSGEESNINYEPAAAPDDMPKQVGVLDSAGSTASLAIKSRMTIQAAIALIKAKLSPQIANSLIIALQNNPRLLGLVQSAQASGNWAALAQYWSNSGGVLRTATGTTMTIIAELAERNAAIKFLKNTLFNSKILGPLALLFETYDIITDYNREGLSGRVICKIISAILGLGSVITAATGVGSGIALGLSALWTVATIGCGLIPQSDKKADAYKNLNQSEIDKAEATVTLDSLPQSDQNLVRDLFKSKNRGELINNLRTLRDSKKFEKPAESMALIQKQLASGSGQIVPLG